MKIPLSWWLWALGAGLGALAAEESRPPAGATPAPQSAATPTPPASPTLRGKLNFIPPKLGAPTVRVDAGSRGDGPAITSLYVLAPETIGLTRRAQPSLHWFQTKPAKLPFEFALLRPGTAQPVLTLQRADGTPSGFQQVKLSAHGVTLESGVDYQWVVALVREAKARSRDIIASGWIRYQPEASAREAWYDLVEKASDEVAAHPRDAQARADRADLLRSVGLGAVAGETRDEAPPRRER